MRYILLFLLVIFVSAQSVLKKQYNVKTKIPNTFFFSSMTAIAEMIFFIVCSGFKINFISELMPYSIGFGIAFSVMLIGGFLAIKWGPMSITVLMGSYSLIIPTFYGIFVFGDKLKAAGIVGLVLLMISLFIIGVKKEKLNFSVKWFVSLMLSFTSNGICSILLGAQQKAFDGLCKNEFMFFAMILSAIILLVASFVNKEKIKENFKLCSFLGAGNGISNAIVNLLVMILVADIPSAILYPCVSAGGIVIGFIMAITVYKEKLTNMQLVGYFLGVVSVVCLNL